ncbi:MAG: hypothetical protein V4754_07470 [Pseudomonadota bacterium]
MVDIDMASVAFMTMRAQVWKHIASREEAKPAMAKALDTTTADLAATLEHYAAQALSASLLVVQGRGARYADVARRGK